MVDYVSTAYSCAFIIEIDEFDILDLWAVGNVALFYLGVFIWFDFYFLMFALESKIINDWFSSSKSIQLWNLMKK